MGDEGGVRGRARARGLGRAPPRAKSSVSPAGREERRASRPGGRRNDRRRQFLRRSRCPAAGWTWPGEGGRRRRRFPRVSEERTEGRINGDPAGFALRDPRRSWGPVAPPGLSPRALPSYCRPPSARFSPALRAACLFLSSASPLRVCGAGVSSSLIGPTTTP